MRICSTLGAGGLTVTPKSAASNVEMVLATSDTPNWLVAANAAESKKAHDLRALRLSEVTSFTDYFLICTSANVRQGQAISDEVARQLKLIGELPVSVEGYESGDWILMDYGDFIVHIFSPTARSYYDLERLWRHAPAVDLEGARKS